MNNNKLIPITLSVIVVCGSIELIIEANGILKTLFILSLTLIVTGLFSVGCNYYLNKGYGKWNANIED